MNRILLWPGEISGGVAVFSGDRARHVAETLHGTPGMPLKTGELGGRAGTGEILSVERAADGGTTVRVRIDHTETPPEPWADLILAPPRPRVLKRLLPHLAAMGVGTVVLAGAEKVEKDFWGATVLKPENMEGLLVEGLMQAGTTAMPRVELRRNFRRFVREELDAMFPASDRVVAHPGGACGGAAAEGRLLLAIGPEGGWTPSELELLEERGFRRYSLGRRILRTGAAALALLGRFYNEREETAT